MDSPKVLSKEQRMRICKSCPHLEKKFFTPEKCGVCGCFLKLKTSMESESCPLGKW